MGSHHRIATVMALRKKMIIDSDTGIDDAMAILMALEAHKRKAVEVLAITAVSGNTTEPDAERNILRTLDAAGCGDIPVHRGATEALVVPYPHEGGHYHGLDGFNDIKFDTTPDMKRINEEPAWQAISRLSKEYPNEITLVAIGPLTNVAIAMKADPGLAERLKEIFIMGGNIEAFGNVTEAAEFNFHADPEAAYTVLRLTKCPTTIAPWELSYKYNHVDFDWRREVLGKIETPAAKLINACEEVWFRNWGWGNNWILCDQLAMVAALNSKSVVVSRDVVASVELQGSFTRGMMVLDQRVETRKATTKKNVTVIEKLDTSILMDYLLKAFSQTD